MRRLFSILFLICFSLAAQATSFPDYRTVLEQFFRRYEYSPDYSRYVNFLKMKDGWLVEHVDWSQDKTISNRELFWSAKTGKYEEVHNFPILIGSQDWEAIEQSYIVSPPIAGAYYYERCPYYGYKNWDIDVIKDFGDEKVLGDTVLEGLARAYSNYAQAYLWQQYGLHSHGEGSAVLRIGNVDQTRVEEFIKYEDLSLAAYERLMKQNPKYETMLGEVGIKYACENCYAFQCLTTLGSKEKAKKYVKTGLFNDETTNWLNNILLSLKPGAILYTNGDLDTYGLWYLQETQGLRRDVNIINLSLLSVPQYLEAIQKGFCSQPPVSFSFSLDEMYSGKLDFVYPQAESENEYTPHEAIARIIKDMKEKEEPNDRVVERMYLKIHNNKSAFKDLEEPSLPDTTRFRLEDNYLLMSDLVQMDLLGTYFGKRPIYYLYSSDASFLTSHFLNAVQGVPSELMPLPQSYNNNTYYGLSRFYTNLVTDFKWPFSYTSNSGPRYIMRNQMKHVYSSAAWSFRESDPAKAKNIMNRLSEKLPETVYPLGLMDVYNARLYYELGESQKGNKLLTATVNYSFSQLKELENIPRHLHLPSAKEKEIDEFKNVLKEARAVADEFEETGLAKDISLKIEAVAGF
jgi:hypothetical protein